MTGTDTQLERVEGAGLALTNDQTWWNNRQKAALAQLGVQGASDGDLIVFMHVAQRTGLDPFARQIYMIGRKGRELVEGQWVDVVKQTIQTGIDGFRLVARRAAERLGETLEYEDTLWADADGNWTDLWTKATAPTAAKVTVLRDGRRFSAVAMYREYVQTKANGDANAMWSKMPANQLAKCAEALALRKAYPQDLSGIYADEEMGQAGNPERAGRRQARAASRMAEVLTPAADETAVGAAGEEDAPGGRASSSTPPDEDGDVVDGEVVESPTLDMSSKLAKKLFAVMHEAGITEDTQHAFLSKSTGRTITSRKDLTEAEASDVINALEEALREPFPEEQP